MLMAQRGYIRRHGLLVLLFGLGLIAFSIVSYPFFKAIPLFPLFFACGGFLCLTYGILTLRRKGQSPDLDEQKP